MGPAARGQNDAVGGIGRRQASGGLCPHPPEAEPLDTIRLSKFWREEGVTREAFVKVRAVTPSSLQNPLTEIEVQGLGPWWVWATPTACLPSTQLP